MTEAIILFVPPSFFNNLFLVTFKTFNLQSSFVSRPTTECSLQLPGRARPGRPARQATPRRCCLQPPRTTWEAADAWSAARRRPQIAGRDRREVLPPAAADDTGGCGCVVSERYATGTTSPPRGAPLRRLRRGSRLP